MNGSFAYLLHLTWAVPILIGQAVLLARRHKLREALREAWVPVAFATLWFTFADHFAIVSGVWSFAPGLHCGLTLAGVPIEEGVFFMVTSLLVAFGVVLLRKRT